MSSGGDLEEYAGPAAGADLSPKNDLSLAPSGAAVPAGTLGATGSGETSLPAVRHLEVIHKMAESGRSLSAPMATTLPMPSWDDIVILGAQLDPLPLDEDAPVRIETIIGPRAQKPLVLSAPVFVSHMSFGALSKEAKIALARGAARVQIAACSGEGGVLPEEKAGAFQYIFEYVPNRYSLSTEMLRSSDAVEIKIGQGVKPGLGGHLPGIKVTPEIAAIRGKETGKDILSPSRFPGLNSREDLRDLVDQLKKESGGRPVGIKIAAEKIEADLEFCLYARPDFVTIDGRGGGTGSAPELLRDATTLPTVFALARARRFLDKKGSEVSLIITGGLRVSSDIAKALALGADAAALATGSLMALGCRQYRICHTGRCPMGIATQVPELRAKLDTARGEERVANYFSVIKEELKTYARICGRSRLADLGPADLAALSNEISEHTGIQHA
jgi:glutamate synthase domain-containing protein 2